MVLSEGDSPWFQTVYWLFIVENGCIPILKVGLRLNTFSTEESPGRESYWLTLGASGYLISMEKSVLGLCNHRSCFFMWKVWHLTGSREAPPASVGGYLGGRVSDPLYLTMFPGTICCPTCGCDGGALA